MLCTFYNRIFSRKSKTFRNCIIGYVNVMKHNGDTSFSKTRIIVIGYSVENA